MSKKCFTYKLTHSQKSNKQFILSRKNEQVKKNAWHAAFCQPTEGKTRSAIREVILLANMHERLKQEGLDW